MLYKTTVAQLEVGDYIAVRSEGKKWFSKTTNMDTKRLYVPSTSMMVHKIEKSQGSKPIFKVTLKGNSKTLDFLASGSWSAYVIDSSNLYYDYCPDNHSTVSFSIVHEEKNERSIIFCPTIKDEDEIITDVPTTSIPTVEKSSSEKSMSLKEMCTGFFSIKEEREADKGRREEALKRMDNIREQLRKAESEWRKYDDVYVKNNIDRQDLLSAIQSRLESKYEEGKRVFCCGHVLRMKNGKLIIDKVESLD